MSVIATVASVVSSLFLTPFLMFVLCIVFLASFGKSLGVRRLYVKTLLMIFEYGRQSIEVVEKQTRLIHHNESDDEGYSEEVDSETNPPSSVGNNSSSVDMCNGNARTITSDNSVINRDDKLIFVPEPTLITNNHHKNIVSPPTETADNNQDASSDYTSVDAQEELLDFDLSQGLDYIKAGFEAIIEDQVTSRFEAEELKSWNLLTRTNRHYEFISFRLTIIWAFGFIIRYCFLFPLRVFICFIGVSWIVLASFLVFLIPPKYRNWFAKVAYIAYIRILARSLSAVINYHNVKHMPKHGGICVANHTSPVDIIMLSYNCNFSLVMWLTLCTALVGYIPEGSFKSWVNRYVSIMCFELLSSALSSVITYHNTENRPKNGICVANHTSPIDVLVLMCDNCYSLIGQRHGGFLGILQRALARASPHIWFERSEVKDRHAVAARLKEHVSNPNNPPILIFPEGTCINNTSVMQFKKGSFEVGSVIFPVAIKYDARFGDAFWNSSKYSMMQYLSMMMTSWAIVCDVWYLPPMYQEEGESAIDFANRVKSVIAKQGGLVDLVWDGQLKRSKPKKEWKEAQQEVFSKRLKTIDYESKLKVN